MIQNEEYIEGFVEEARAHIETAESCLLTIDVANPEQEMINSLFRAVHSIKGTAGFFNLSNIVKLSHCMENLLGEVRNKKMTLTSEMVDALISANDCLKTLVEDVLNSDNADPFEYISLIKAFLDDNAPEKSLDTNVIDERLADAIENIISPPLEPDEVVTNNTNIVCIDENPTKNRALNIEDSIRVHVSLLNNLLNLASEMVLGRNQLLRAMESYRKSIPGIDSILQNIDHITTELQEKVMQTRMQPVSNVFSKFPRIMRELSKQLGKEIELKIEGSEVELDKSIIESLGDPLTHLIRNAADHGLEKPEEREKVGKSRFGNIYMKAYHESGYVNIDIIDDGAGVDIERIKHKAFEKGLIDKNEFASMGELEILHLLFAPGFSTADTVTDISGRGVGMDVVKTNIERLGGTIEIFTVLGQGTTFRLLLPLTLAIIPSIIIEVCGQKFALPQVNLQEIVRIKSDDIERRIEFINNSEVLRLRGGLLPVVHLSNILGLNATDNKKAIDIYESIFKKETKKAMRILVIKIGSRKIGLCVDAIYGSEEILVKPLPSYIKQCHCYSGVTIMGDGKIAMILDPDGIIEKSNLHFTDYSEEKKNIQVAYEEDTIREQQSLLLFKCSGSETMAVDLSMVSRVEEVSDEEIEKIGDMEFIKYRGDSLKLIRPENHLPITKNTHKYKKNYVIIPKHVKHPVGILVEKIEDTIATKIKFTSEEINNKGVIGSSIINDKIVILVNLYELFELAEPEKYITDKSTIKEKELQVLLVEDTPFFLKLERDYLTAAGYKVITATNGRDAFSILQENHFDAVVSDIQMPIMDGIELVKRIRADKKFSNLPVIAVTSLNTESQMNQGLEAGFDVYEFKIDKARLLRVVDEAIQKRRNLS